MEVMKEIKTQTSDQEKIDLQVVLHNMFKGIHHFKFLFIFILVVCLAGYSIISYRRYTPLYETKVTFSVIKKTDASDYYNIDAAKQMQSTFGQVLQSQLLKTIIIDDLGVATLPGYYDCYSIEETNLIIVRAISADAQASYDMMTSLMENYDQVSNLVMSDVRLNPIGQVKVPEKVMNPFLWSNIIINGCIIGIVIDIMILSIYSFLRKTIQNEKDVKEMLNTRCLASVSQISKKKRSNKQKQYILLNKNFTPSCFNEEMRLLRHRIESDAKRHQNKVYVFSSTVPGEGKTTISTNLALFLAGNGKKVVLVDGDLRKPSFEDIFEVKAEHSITEIIHQQCNVYEALIPFQDNLYLLTNIEVEQHPTELLASHSFEALIKELRNDFDFVIIDTPPSGEMGDASIISGYADASIMVVAQDGVPAKRILEAMEMFVYNSHNLLGCVLNRSDNRRGSDRYYYQK